MSAILLNQRKPQQVTLFGCAILAFVPFIWYLNENAIDKLILITVIGLILIGYSITYEVNKEFKNRKRISMFGVTVFKQSLKLFYPEYISLFSASFKKDNDWGTVAALGTQSKSKNIVIKFFKGSKNVIVYKSNDYNTALEKANELGLLLNVKIHNTFKN